MLKLVENADRTTEPAAPNEALTRLLHGWLNLSEQERRSFTSMTNEMTATAAAMDHKNGALITHFHAMASASHTEADKATTVIDQLESVTVNGERVEMHDITTMADTLVNDIIGAVMRLSRSAMGMVYSLEDVTKSLQETEKSIGGIERINRQTTMLALNARIEAERAGAAGATFKVVADEVKELSNSTEAMAIALREQVDGITAGISTNQPVLQALADIDIGAFITTRNKIRDLNERMHIQATRNAKLLGELGNNMRGLSGALEALTRDMQEREMIQPVLTHALGLLAQLVEETASLQQATRDALGITDNTPLSNQEDDGAPVERNEA